MNGKFVFVFKKRQLQQYANFDIIGRYSNDFVIPCSSYPRAIMYVRAYPRSYILQVYKQSLIISGICS